jgi:hypothetical protein
MMYIILSANVYEYIIYYITGLFGPTRNASFPGPITWVNVQT